MATDYAEIIGPLAESLLGQPNPKLSSITELRYGARGSLSVDLVNGVWYDHETGVGGGALDLLTRETKLTGADRFDWLAQHGFAEAAPASSRSRAKIIARYDYTDEGGQLLSQVVRFEPKDFRQRKPNGSGFEWTTKGVRPVPYRLPDLLEAIDRTIFICEGEKDVDRLWALGVAATCNAGGAGKWKRELNEHFRGTDVVIVPDNDAAGQNHALQVAGFLNGVAGRVRILELSKTWPQMPAKADVSDWLDHGGSADELYALVDKLPDWTPGAPEAPAAKRLKSLDIAQWDFGQVPEPDWTVHERIPRRQTALFSGEGAMGKSTLLLQLCCAHASGKDWLFTAPALGPAIFVDAEDDTDVLHRRTAAITKHYGISFAELVHGGLKLISLAGQDAILGIPTRSGKLEPTPLYAELATMAGDLKPVMLGLCSSANFFAGNENDRSQVQQFISMLTHLAIVANGSVVLVTHPSLTGIASNSGLSGSTAWHSAVRARFFLHGVRKDDAQGGEPTTNLREITFKKNNYGPVGESITLHWLNGLFLPVPKKSNLQQAAQDQRDDEVFLAALTRFISQGQNASAAKGPTFAPAVLADTAEVKLARLNGVRLKFAMDRLLEAGKIIVEMVGPPSRRRSRLVPK